MKLLTFQASRFGWKSHSKTLETASDEDRVDESVTDAVVVFLHAEAKDDDEPDERKRVFKHTLEAREVARQQARAEERRAAFIHAPGRGKRSTEFAQGFMEELAERLRGTGYEVWLTPFGWFCSWDLAVYGDSLAKVWKEV